MWAISYLLTYLLPSRASIQHQLGSHGLQLSTSACFHIRVLTSVVTSSPVSHFRTLMKVVRLPPALREPWAGSHSTSPLATNSGCLTLCLAIAILLVTTLNLTLNWGVCGVVVRTLVSGARSPEFKPWSRHDWFYDPTQVFYLGTQHIWQS